MTVVMGPSPGAPRQAQDTTGSHGGLSEFIFARDTVAEETVSPGDWPALQRPRGPSWYHPPGPRTQQACCQPAQPGLDEMRVTNVFLPGSRSGQACWKESFAVKYQRRPSPKLNQRVSCFLLFS